MSKIELSRGWPSRELLMEYGTPEMKTVFSHFSPDPEKIRYPVGRVGGIQISIFQAYSERSTKKNCY
jgi:hypothetical protein